MTIFGDATALPDDASPAHWIASRLGEFGTVGGLVPGGFDRYLVIHLALTGSQAGRDGKVDLVESLSPVMEAHTSTPELSWYAIWEGYDWVGSSLYASVGGGPLARLRSAQAVRRRRHAEQRRSLEVQAKLAEIPTFALPGRRYYLLSGRVASASRITSPDRRGRHAPDLWWPEDRRWFVASDTDLNWFYVGGTETLMVEIEAAHRERTRSVDRAAANASVDRHL